MRLLTITILLITAIPSTVAAEARQVMPGVVEFVLDGPDPVYDLKVANPTLLKMPGLIQFAGISDLKAKHGEPWIVAKQKDAVIVRPGKNPTPIMLLVETERHRVTFRLGFTEPDGGGSAVRYGIVTERPELSERLDRDQVERERRAAAGDAMASPLLAAAVTRRKGPLVVGTVAARWLKDDLVASMHVRNESSAPLQVDEWKVRMDDRDGEPIILNTPSLAPRERGRVVLVLPDAARRLGPLEIVAWAGGAVVGTATTSDWATEEQERFAASLVEELENRRLDHEARDRVHLAAYGVLGAVRLDGVARMGMGAGLRYAKGVDRWWSWEADAAVIDCDSATLGRLLMGGRAQWGSTGWVPVVHLGVGGMAGRVEGETTFGLTGSARLSVERELGAGIMLALGGQLTAAVDVGQVFEAGAQLGARWK